MDTDVEQGEKVELEGLDGPFYAVSPKSLRRARRERLFTQERLASASGVHRATISKVEWGARRRVRADTLQALAYALGMEPWELLVEAESGEEAQDER